MPKTKPSKKVIFNNMLRLLQQMELAYNLSSGINKKQIQGLKTKLENMLKK